MRMQTQDGREEIVAALAAYAGSRQPLTAASRIRCRRVIMWWLHHIGLSTADISAIMRVPARTVRRGVRYVADAIAHGADAEADHDG